MRKFIIAGNWKLNKTLKDGEELVNALKRDLYKIDNIEIVVCPPFTLLTSLGDALTSSNIALGGQDCYWIDEGAFTGEVSAMMLKDAGCKFVIIGHSERRLFFGETNETVNKKIKSVLSHRLTPIFCVGETLAQRESNQTFDILRDQITAGLKEIPSEQMPQIVIAYEPVWAIGTGKTATNAQAQEAHNYIRNLLIKLYNKDIAEQVRIQYGGSVKPDNIADLLRQPDIDGALVGGASLTHESFTKIIKNSSEVIK